MTRRLRLLMAASAIALSAACASTPPADRGDDGAGAQENWLSAAWHWLFPPEPPPMAPPPPAPPLRPPQNVVEVTVAGYPEDMLRACIQASGLDPTKHYNRSALSTRLMACGVAYNDTDAVLRYFGKGGDTVAKPGVSIGLPDEDKPPVEEERNVEKGDGLDDDGGYIGPGDPDTIGHGAGDPDLEIDRSADYYPDYVGAGFSTADLVEALRQSGITVPAGATDAEIIELFLYEMTVADAPAAAAGPGAGSRCEAELDGTGPIRLTCQDVDDYGEPGEIRTAKVPLRGSVIDTLNGLAIQLGGGVDRVSIGRPDKTLCVWDNDNTLPLQGTEYFYPCLAFEEPLSVLVDAGAGSFNQGRIAHQAPKEMVVEQPYILELAIQPLTANLTIEAADATLRDTLGTGLVPGSTETPFDIEFDTVQASKVMSAALVAEGFDVKALTPESQAVMADAPTVWQWRVVPEEDGYGELVYRLAQNLEVDGERFERVVKTIWLDVDVYTIDELLEDDGTPVPRGTGTADAVPTPVTPAADTAANTLINSLTPETPAAAAGSAPGCTWTEGTNPDRFAVVLSNLAYEPPISRLAVTHQDGDRIANALIETGFSVQHCRDLGRSETLNALREVGRKALARKQAGAHPATFFYYSGHGVNIDGTNYVLPVDLPGATTDDIQDGAVSFEQIFNIVSTTVASTSFIVFDACRTVMDEETRGILRSYQPVTWSTGVFQAYATAPGKTAADNGAYSEELAQRIPAESVPANVLFKRVQDAVARRTNEQQHPNYIDLTTGGDFYFKSE